MQMRIPGRERRLKRLFDVVVSAVALVGMSPLLLVLALLVRMNLGSPVFFVQMRPGLRGTPFALVKFRSMLPEVDAQGNPVPTEKRLTSFGRWLRSTSLDELPELWNVLRGEMSLVGPRPLLMEYLPLYSEAQARRHLVRPGLTGLAQVSGRNALSWEEKFALDLEYVESSNCLLDLKILARTVVAVLRRESIGHGDLETMPPFKGS